MRYGQRGGYTPAEQQRRERLRLEAAGRFARGDTIGWIARDLRVTEGSVRCWHRAWRDGGTEALRSKGPVSRERLSPQQWARLEAELRKGPLAHGFANDQRRTLRVSAKSGSTVIRCRVMHICPVDDLVDLTYRQPFASGPAWTGIGLAGSR